MADPVAAGVDLGAGQDSSSIVVVDRGGRVLGIVSVVRLQAGDKLVVRSEFALSENAKQNVLQSLKAWCRDEYDCAVLDKGLSLEVFRP